MADYFCFPIWESGLDGLANINPKDLPISEELKSRLMDWSDELDAILVVDDPASSRFETAEQELAFCAAGRRLAGDLKRELGPDFEVTYK